MAKRGREHSRSDPAAEAFHAAVAELRAHPLFAPLVQRANLSRPGDADRSIVPADGLCVVDPWGTVHVHPTRRETPGTWVWAIAHSLLHLGFGHLDPSRLRSGGAGFEQAWAAACCVAVDRFLSHLKVGTPPMGLPDLPSKPEAELAASWRERGVPARFTGLGTCGAAPDMVPADRRRWGTPQDPKVWEGRLADGLAAAVAAALAVAGGELDSISGGAGRKTRWSLALEWFVSSYPLLGGLASSLKLVEDVEVCRRLDVSIAAVSAQDAALYVNPQAGLTVEECRFVIAHELLHAGLRHDTRAGGRDPYYWNVACDFVINSWLVEMAVGQMPDGVLYDPELRGMGAEEVYDRITSDLRRYRKLATLRGVDACDVLPGRVETGHDGVDLDELYRRALHQGLEYHVSGGRGYLPAGLEEEIRALAQPPVPWDVELARWFDERFTPLERRRSYARASRRQSSTPDIPRPALVTPEDLRSLKTFAVVVDTSGSMPAELLGKALGAIASYASVKDVPGVRVVFCDAAAYDAGFLDPVEISGKVKVRGRGGTVLQPGIDLLERAEDFPKDGPILVITDGYCDRVTVKRDHAFLIPAGARLPFEPRGPVFRFT